MKHYILEIEDENNLVAIITYKTNREEMMPKIKKALEEHNADDLEVEVSSPLVENKNLILVGKGLKKESEADDELEKETFTYTLTPITLY